MCSRGVCDTEDRVCVMTAAKFPLGFMGVVLQNLSLHFRSTIVTCRAGRTLAHACRQSGPIGCRTVDCDTPERPARVDP